MIRTERVIIPAAGTSLGPCWGYCLTYESGSANALPLIVQHVSSAKGTQEPGLARTGVFYQSDEELRDVRLIPADGKAVTLIVDRALGARDFINATDSRPGVMVTETTIAAGTDLANYHTRIAIPWHAVEGILHLQGSQPTGGDPALAAVLVYDEKPRLIRRCAGVQGQLPLSANSGCALVFRINARANQGYSAGAGPSYTALPSSGGSEPSYNLDGIPPPGGALEPWFNNYAPGNMVVPAGGFLFRAIWQLG